MKLSRNDHFTNDAQLLVEVLRVLELTQMSQIEHFAVIKNWKPSKFTQSTEIL